MWLIGGIAVGIKDKHFDSENLGNAVFAISKICVEKGHVRLRPNARLPGLEVPRLLLLKMR